jgi:hypothetical protein
MKWQTVCKLVTVLPMKSSKTDLGFKTVHDGSQNNPQRCTNKCAWTIANIAIINGVETWFHHFKLESKWQSMECKHPQMPESKSSKTNLLQEN